MKNVFTVAALIVLATLATACGNHGGPGPSPVGSVTYNVGEFAYTRAKPMTLPNLRNVAGDITVLRDDDASIAVSAVSCGQLPPTAPDSDKYQCQTPFALQSGVQYRVEVSDPAMGQIGCFLCNIVWQTVMIKGNAVTRSKQEQSDHGPVTVGLFTPRADGSFQ